jgi:hypothetical protein
VVRLALFERLDPGDLLFERFDSRRNPQAQVGAFEGGPMAHLLGGLSRGGNCAIDVGGGGQRDVGDMLAGHRTSELVDLIAGAFRPFPGDVQLEIFGHYATSGTWVSGPKSQGLEAPGGRRSG